MTSLRCLFEGQHLFAPGEPWIDAIGHKASQLADPLTGFLQRYVRPATQPHVLPLLVHLISEDPVAGTGLTNNQHQAITINVFARSSRLDLPRR